jgi:hypothetical protein
MSAEHNDEQSTELTYPTTIRLVLASDDSDKENHTPDIRRDKITIKLEQRTTESLGGHSNEGAGSPTAIDYSNPLHQDLPRSITPDPGTNGAEATRCYNTVQTPTLCKPDTSDRPYYFPFNLLNLATPLTTYVVRLVLLILVLLSSLPCYLYDAVLILTSDILYSLINTFLSILRYISTHVFVVEP